MIYCYEQSDETWVRTDSFEFYNIKESTSFFNIEPNKITNGVYLYEAPDKPKVLIIETVEVTDMGSQESYDSFINRILKIPPYPYIG